jgi:hypothetical protein
MQSNEAASKRAWLSPLTGLLFIVIGVTGSLMFFHVRLPGMTFLHELGGMLFVIVAGLHLQLNWRPFLAFCRQKKGRLSLAVGAGIVTLLLALGLGHDESHRRPGEGRSAGDASGMKGPMHQPHSLPNTRE